MNNYQSRTTYSNKPRHDRSRTRRDIHDRRIPRTEFGIGSGVRTRDPKENATDVGYGNGMACTRHQGRQHRNAEENTTAEAGTRARASVRRPRPQRRSSPDLGGKRAQSHSTITGHNGAQRHAYSCRGKHWSKGNRSGMLKSAKTLTIQYKRQRPTLELGATSQSHQVY